MYIANKIEAIHPAYRQGYEPSRTLLIFCLLITALLCLTAASNTATATTYYLDASATGLETGTSWQDAWTTLSQAQAVLQDGDICYIRDGNYGEFREGNINRNDWVTYKADTGHTPVLTRIYISNNNQNSYLIFDGFKILDGVALQYISYVKVRNCYINTIPQPHAGFYAPYFIGSDMAVLVRSAHYITIENNDILKAYRGIGLKSPSDNVILRNNVIHHLGEDGISAPGTSNLLIEGNTIFDIDKHRAGFVLRGIQVGTFIIGETIIQEGTGAEGIVVSTGTMLGLFQTNEIEFQRQDRGGGTVTGQTSGATLSNIDYRDGAHTDGIQVHTDGVTDIVIRGNTIIREVSGGGDQAMKLETGGGAGIENITLENNLIWAPKPLLNSGGNLRNLRFYNNTFHTYGPSGNGFDMRGNTQITAMYNNIFACVLPSAVANMVSSHGNNIFADSPSFANATELVNTIPEFVDAASGDFRLAAGSGAIDFADPTYAPATDILGVSRVFPPDAGCYEYISGSPDTTPPSTPQNLTAQVISESQINLSWDASNDPESGVSYYKIYRDSNEIDTSVSTSYSNTGLNSGSTYSYEVSAINGATLESARSNTAQATTLSDTTPPSIVSVAASETSLEIVFNEILDPCSAENISNYAIIDDGNNGISISSAFLHSGDTRITLSTAAHTEITTYTLTVTDVEDLAGNPMTGTTTYEYNGGLVAHWKFNDAAGSTAADSSGNSNTGTLINGPVWTVQGELSFDGTDDYVEVPDSDYLDIESQITLSVWVRLSNYDNDWPKIIIKPFEAYEAPWELFSLDLGRYGDRARFIITDGVPAGSGATVVNNNNLLALNEWYHIAATYNGALMSLYVDGELIATQETTIQIGTNNMPLGIGGRLGVNSFNGLIDEVRIYNRALTADEVSNLALVFLPIDDKEVEEGSTLTFEVRTQDPNQEVLIEANPNLPFEPNDVFFSNIFTWTPTYGDAGSYEVTFEAPHGEFVDFETITITVHKPTRPVYRFWSPTNSRHFYTIKEAEKDKLINIYAHVWTYEDVVYYAFAEDSEPNLVPVYRFWSPVLKAHFYTIEESEKQKLIDWYQHVWTYEGIVFYAYPEGQQPQDTKPVWRFWSPISVLGTHFYTISESEKSKLIDNWSHAWTYEGIAWYAYTSY